MSKLNVQSGAGARVLSVGVRLGVGAGLGLVVGLGGVPACTPISGLIEDHCANQDGDAWCGRVHAGDARQYCALGTCELEALDGCVADRPVEDACYSPCGEDKSLEEDPECEGVADASSSGTLGETEATSEPTGGPTTAGSMSASGTEGSSSTTSSGCTESSECGDAASPICVDTACVPCTSDEECLAKSPGAPACNEDGQCVTCTPTNASACTDTTPICNAANECEGCVFHEQCPGTACDIATGACFAEDCVVEVDGDGGADYMNIEAALMDGCVVFVHELNAGASYQQAVNVDGIKVALLAAPGEDPLVQGTGGNPSLDVSNDAIAYVQGLTFSQNTAAGITANGATVYLDRTRVVSNAGGGIRLTNTAEGHLRNCFVGGDVNDVSALEAVGSSVDILYSTLGAGFGNAAALRCSGTGMVHVRNSLVVARTDDPAVACTTDSFANSLTEDDLGDMNTNWFAGYGTGNFSLSGMAPPAILTTAQWMTGDPLVDIDGDARPTEDATADVAGADIP